mmetsp:Transcript_53362/g.114692  ORF Transcript_53362/g.114692 Transcript_53362/m.114692 type:complete len:434 (+) Transcript_53362:325-1626(+)
MALVDQADINAFLVQSLDSIQASVEGVAVGDEVACGPLTDDIVLAKLEFIALTKERFAFFAQDLWDLRTSAVDEPQAFLPEDGVNYLLHLVHIGRHEQLCAWPSLVGQATVREEVVVTEMAIVVRHVVDAGMAKVAHDIATIEPSHGDLADDHLLKRSEGAEDSLTIVVEAKAGACGEVSTLHDTTGDVNLGMSHADLLKAARPFEITIDDPDPVPSLFQRRDLVQDRVHAVTEDLTRRPKGARAKVFRVRVGLLALRTQAIRCGLQASLLEVRQGLGCSQGIVTMRRSLGALDAGTHWPFEDNSEWAVCHDGSTHCSVDRFEVLPVHVDRLDVVSLEGLANVIASEVLRRVAGNGDIIVVNEKLHVQPICGSDARSLRCVALHLGAVGTEGTDHLFGAAHRNAVNHWPHVAQAAGAELDALRAAKFGVTGKR